MFMFQPANPRGETMKGPIEQTYDAAQRMHPEAVVLMRCGDFYEAFGESAETTARALGLAKSVLRDRVMAGFPAMYCEAYVSQLVAVGHRVVTVEYVPDAKGQPTERVVVHDGDTTEQEAE